MSATVKQLGSLWYRVDAKGEPQTQECVYCHRAAVFFENTGGRSHCVCCNQIPARQQAEPRSAESPAALGVGSFSKAGGA